MVQLNLRLACFTIAAILYSAQAAPLGSTAGSVVTAQSAQPIGAVGAQGIPVAPNVVPREWVEQLQALHARQVEYGRYLMRRVYSTDPRIHHNIAHAVHNQAAKAHATAAATFSASGNPQHQKEAQEHAAKAAAHRAEANNHLLALDGQAHGAFHLDAEDPMLSEYRAHQSLRDHGLAHDHDLATAGDHHDDAAATLQNFHAVNRVGGNIPRPH